MADESTGGRGRGTSNVLVNSEWFRETMEEFRRAVTETIELRTDMGGLRQEFHSLKETMDRLIDTIRGTDSGLGLAGQQALLDNRITALETRMADALTNGTPHSRAAISLLDQRVTQSARDITEMQRAREKGIGRGWQIAFFVGGTSVALLSLLAAVALVVVELWKH